MRSKVLNEAGERSFALIFETGDEPVSLLERLARENNVTAARFTAIGAFREVVVGYFDWEKKEYLRIPIREQVEVLSLVGNVALAPDGSPRVHAHVVVGKADGTAHGGHLIEGHVLPRLEVMVMVSRRHRQRRIDPETRLALLDP